VRALASEPNQLHHSVYVIKHLFVAFRSMSLQRNASLRGLNFLSVLVGPQQIEVCDVMVCSSQAHPVF